VNFLVLPQLEGIEATFWACQQISWIQNAVVGGWACSQTMKDHFQGLEKRFSLAV